MERITETTKANSQPHAFGPNDKRHVCTDSHALKASAASSVSTATAVASPAMFGCKRRAKTGTVPRPTRDATLPAVHTRTLRVGGLYSDTCGLNWLAVAIEPLHGLNIIPPRYRNMQPLFDYVGNLVVASLFAQAAACLAPIRPTSSSTDHKWFVNSASIAGVTRKV